MCWITRVTVRSTCNPDAWCICLVRSCTRSMWFVANRSVPRSLSKIEFKEVQSCSRPIGRGVRTEWPPVTGVENTPGFEVSDRALDGRTQPIYLGIEFLLPVKQFPALGLLERGDEARALITLVADP